ncbi:MAG: hypothetical protein HY040_21075 [Planctomycetes bacterium]|nr:hypothetical protein [Planctomycetota bacterium]
MQSKRSPRILFCVFVLAALLCTWWLLSLRRNEEYVSLPADEEVEFVTAELFSNPNLQTSPAVPEFQVPSKYVPRILRAFRPAKRRFDLGLNDYFALGRLTIKTRSEKAISVTFYFGGHNPLAFKLDEFECMRFGNYSPALAGLETSHIDEGSQLGRALRLISEGAKGQNALENTFQWLEISAGLRPPKE